jgi:hypothetical protein
MDIFGGTYHIMILIYNMEGTYERIQKKRRKGHYDKKK